MRVNTQDLMSVTDANNKGVSWLVAQAQDGRAITLLKNNRAEAIVVGIDAAERLQHVEDLEEDLRLLTVALVRMATDDGVRHSLDDVIADLGIDLDEDIDKDE